MSPDEVTAPTTIRLLVADDQAMIRAGLRMILDNEPDLAVVAEAANGIEAVDAAASARPDVVLMDVRMPRLDGIEATRRIVATGPAAPSVLVLTTFDDDEYVFNALRAGASGFLLKDVGPDPLIEAIHTVARRESLLAPAVTRRVVERYVELEQASSSAAVTAAAAAAVTPPRSRAAVAVARAALTDRERQVLVGLAAGRSNGELAADLFLSEATVKTHVSSVLSKLGLRSRVQAVIAAYESGLVRPGDDRRLDFS
ncbi:MAG TPA: response regulator transcription factor [Acidimicrobiales bacterium]|jgi:DNA-binding NarL/FixJ family response regulator|nr:response regulator transcription factor [Acidimicrobiales bacterium]